ncbi:MAG: hypothetical protein ACRDIB_11465, partial [Ardenticatenaceae bacterium]
MKGLRPATPSLLWQQLLLLLLLLFYWAVSLTHLTVVPPVYEDEPWQASTGWKLATEGVFGSDMFAGLAGMERRYYGYLPLHPMILAATFRLAGLGLFQDRFESVAMGLLVLALTYALGRRLFGCGVGLLAVGALLLVRSTGLTPYQQSGILLLDIARIARYDMVVPVFGLASLHAYLSARNRMARGETRARYWYGLAGLLAGLASLSHLYGAFWITALGLLALWERAGLRNLLSMAGGFLAPWVLYLIYVAGDLPSWRAQTRIYAPRFELLNPRWYWSNLVRERHRYGAGLGPARWSYLLRPGFWFMLGAVPASVVALARRGLSGRDRARRAILVPLLMLPLLFALLIYLKLANYLVTVLPLAALAVAWGTLTLWRWAGQANGGRWLRVALLLLLLAVATEGLARVVALQRAAATTTAYDDFIARLRAYIPPGSRVLGLHHYWLGMEDTDYWNWAVALDATNPNGSSRAAMIAALEDFDPDFILLDSQLQEYFRNAPPTDPRPRAIYEWLESSEYTLVAV